MTFLKFVQLFVSSLSIIVPWSEIDDSLRNEMAQYIHEMLAFDKDGNAVVPP